jgi:NADH-quinone oxidoreductase subunit N
MIALAAQAAVKGPHIDYAGLSPLLALLGGAIVVLMLGLFGPKVRSRLVPAVSMLALATTAGLSIWLFHRDTSIISDALRIDDLALALDLIFCGAGLTAIVLSMRAEAPRAAGHGEFHSLLLSSIAGMVILASAQNLIVVFVGYELLSISLYVLCATEMMRERSLESGLKYLVIGSVGSATLLFGLAFIYGATGSTDFSGIRAALDGSSSLASDSLLLTGLGLSLVGLAFKASVAPFHQWTPDVYEGAPTPVTAFMAVATKAAAFAIMLRFLDVALIDTQLDYAPFLAVLAAVTIIVGNVGALTQTSVKRMLAWSAIAQSGYMLAGVLVATETGIRATVFYLVVYATMNLAAFAVIIARERQTGLGDDVSALSGIGATHPLLAWPMTISMLSLAGFPATAGFVGKFYLIDAAVGGSYAWVGVFIVIGSMISLGYYLRVVAVMWMPDRTTAPASSAAAATARPAMAGGAPESPEDAPVPATGGAQPEIVAVALLFGALSLVLGIIPSPLMDLCRDAASSFASLL